MVDELEIALSAGRVAFRAATHKISVWFGASTRAAKCLSEMSAARVHFSGLSDRNGRLTDIRHVAVDRQLRAHCGRAAYPALG